MDLSKYTTKQLLSYKKTVEGQDWSEVNITRRNKYFYALEELNKRSNYVQQY